MKVYLDSRANRLLKDSISVTELVAGLELLPDNANYTRVGGTCNHHGPSDRGIANQCQTPNNDHYATAQVNQSIQAIAAEYRRQFPNEPRLAVNDMSLPFGGRFDIYGRWAGNQDHQYHRNGLDVDGRSRSMSGDLYEDRDSNGVFDLGIDRLIVDRNNDGRFDTGSLFSFPGIAEDNGVFRATLEYPEAENEEHWHLYFWNVDRQ